MILSQLLLRGGIHLVCDFDFRVFETYSYDIAGQ